MATRLTTTKGNTIKEILESQQFSDAESIRVEILDKFKLVSTIPIVALFVVSAIVIVLPILFTIWAESQEARFIKIQGRVNFEELSSKTRFKSYLVPRDMRIEETGIFSIPILYRTHDKVVNIESKNHNTLTLTLNVNTDKNTIEITSSEPGWKSKPVKIDQETLTARIQEDIYVYVLSPPTREDSKMNPLGVQ